MLPKIFSGVSIAFVFALVPLAFAGKVELTTYYPAPFGEYAELNASKSFIPPRMTTVQRDLITSTSTPKLAQGMVIFNTTTNQLEVNRSADPAVADWGSATGGGARWSAVGIISDSGPYPFVYCIMDATNGATTCKVPTVTGFPVDWGWASFTSPFAATTAGNYSLSCASGSKNNSEGVPVPSLACFRLNADTGTFEHKSYNYSTGKWYSFYPNG